jgi:hypothetical protein
LQKSLSPLELGACAPPLGAVVVAWPPPPVFELGAWAPPPAFPTVFAGGVEAAGVLPPPELLVGVLGPVDPVAPVVPVVPLLSSGGACSPPGTVSAGAGGSVWALSLLLEPPQADRSPRATTTSVRRTSRRRMVGF